MGYLIYLGVLVIWIIFYVWGLPRLLGLKARMRNGHQILNRRRYREKDSKREDAGSLAPGPGKPVRRC
jgi:hypothetical protein